MENDTILDTLQIQEIIPHRYPFLFVDKIIKLEPKETIIGIKNVTFNEPFFQGHFPGRPLMPGVLMIEALAQTSAILAKKSGVKALEEGDFLLVSVDKYKFKRAVQPGDILQLQSTFQKSKGPLWITDCVASVNGELAARGVVSAMISKRISS